MRGQQWHNSRSTAQRGALGVRWVAVAFLAGSFQLALLAMLAPSHEGAVSHHSTRSVVWNPPPPLSPPSVELAAAEDLDLDAPELPDLHHALSSYGSVEVAPLMPRVDLAPPTPAAVDLASMPSGVAGDGGQHMSAQRQHSPDLRRFYPPQARRRGITGETLVQLRVDARGRVRRAVIISSDPPGVFDDAAQRVAMTLRYHPAQKGDRAVASEQELRLVWDLSR